MNVSIPYKDSTPVEVKEGEFCFHLQESCEVIKVLEYDHAMLQE